MQTRVNTLLTLARNGVPGVDLHRPIGDILRTQHHALLIGDEVMLPALAYIARDPLFWLSVGNELETALKHGLLAPPLPTIVASIARDATTNVMETCQAGVKTPGMPRGLLMQSRSTCCNSANDTLRWCPHDNDEHCADVVSRLLVLSSAFRQHFIELAQTKHHITLREHNPAGVLCGADDDRRTVCFTVSLA